MSIRSIRYELEAKLEGRTGGLFSKPIGKLERKSYGDGGERLKIWLRNLKVPDNSIAVVTAGGMEIAEVPIHDRAGRIDTESRDPNDFPNLQADQSIEVHVGNVLILTGKLYKD